MKGQKVPARRETGSTVITWLVSLNGELKFEHVRILYFPQLIQSRLWPVGAVVLQVKLTEK